MSSSIRPRVVVALADPAETSLVAEWLVAEGFEPVRRASARAAQEEIQARPYDLLVTDAALTECGALLMASRARRPKTPCVLLDEGTAAIRHDPASALVMRIARPLERAMFTCTVSMAILDGRPLRRSLRKPVSRFEVIVNGVRSELIDVSNEGLRFAMPQGRQAVPPPYFNVRVPLVGVALTVQRMWARSLPGNGRPELWCGAALAGNRPQAEGGWRMFVDTIPASTLPNKT